MPTPDDLRARLDELSSLDRERFRRRISGAEKIEDRKKRDKVMKVLDDEMAAASAAYGLREAATPEKISYPAQLPITDRRAELLGAIRDHQVVIVAGETGSGKSTQLPKLCLELGRGVEGLIAHTQPRRLAARTIAARVAEELNTTVGGTVGFAVRFSEQVGPSTMVKLMTDGLLLAEIQRDRDLLAYDTIIVDEAHERSLNVDFLLGYLHQLLGRRPDLKVIITSATIDTERFADHFTSVAGDVPVIEVSGRTYSVEVRYRPLDDPDQPEPKDQPQGIADAVQALHAETSGDILVFCAGERDIRDATDAIDELRLRHTEVLPLYARLPAAEQHRVFAPASGRRVVVATNVAETSLTVPGVRSVVDAGTARISRYSRRTKVQRLPIEPVSQASANQRAGRCGRLGPGICIRLYSEDDFDARPEFTEPEVQRTSLASVILQMAAIGLGEVTTFPFLDPPDVRSIKDGVGLLDELGAIDPSQEGTRGWLTPTGRRLARFPLDPRIGRMVLEAHERLCLDDVLIIASALSVQDPRERPAGRESEADALHARFSVGGSDFLGWLELWRHLRAEQRARSGNQFRRMCREEHLNYLRVREWMGVHAQLRQTADELKLRRNRTNADFESIHRSILAGLLSHVGQRDPSGFEYRGARGAKFAIQPGSVLFRQAPEWVVAAELVETSRLWGRGIAEVDPSWVEDMAPHLVRRSYSDPWWDAEQGSAIASETVTLYGLTLVSGRPVQYARIDAAEARHLFIRHALLDGEWDARHAFITHNRQQFAEVRDLEARTRAGDLMVDDEALIGWFAGRIPDDVVTVRHFDRWWRDQRQKTPQLLDLSVDDILEPGGAVVDAEAFPETWHVGDLELPLSYEFDPASPTDGVTVHLPVGVLDRIDPAVFEWNVPGLRAELLEALVRSLPKAQRKPFLPIPETVSDLVGELDESGRLIDEVRRALAARSGEPILPDAFRLDEIPHRLRPYFSIVADDGTELAGGSDLDHLRHSLQEQTRAAVGGERHPLEDDGLTAWTFGSLPETVTISGGGPPMTAYPTLVDEGDAVAIRLLATAEEQAMAHWDGVRRLAHLNLKMRRDSTPLTNDTTQALAASPYASPADWREDCITAAFDTVLSEGALPRTEEAFEALLARLAGALPGLMAELRSVSIEVLKAYGRVVSALEQLVGDRFDDLVEDVVGQLSTLVYDGFISGLGAERLGDVRRYLDGALYRVERVREHLPRDQERQRGVNALEREHDVLVESLGWTPALVDLAWSLQELRLSVFAQPIGAKAMVSEKRVRAALRDAAG